MAKVALSSTTNSNNSTVSELTVGIAGSSSGDLLVVYLESSDVNSVFQQKSGTTGWTKRMNTPYVYGDRSFALFTKTAGASETAPTFEEASARSGYMTAVYTVVENADTSSPVIAYTEDRSDVGNHFNLPTVDTTGDDDALILAFCGADSYSRALSFLPTVNHYASSTKNSHAVIAGWFYQQDGGATPALEVLKSGTSTNQVGKLVVAIKDDGTEAITGQVIPTTEPAELIQGCLYNQITSSNVTSLITDLDGDTPTSKNLSSEESNPFTNLDSYPWTYKYTSNSSNPNLAGGSFYDSTLDLSDSLISFSMAPKSYDSVKSWDSGGRYFGLVSGSDSAAEVWKVEAKDTELRVKGGIFPYIIDTSMSSYSTFGTFDATDVTKFCFGINRDNTTENTIGYIYKLGTMVLGYGNSTTPCSFSDAARHSKTASLRTVQSQGGQSSSQFYISQDVNIGNYGTNATYWKSSNQSMEMPAAYDVGGRFVHHQVDTSRLSLTIKAGASDTINLSSCTLNFGDFHNFVVGASCSASATYNFNGLVVLNSLVELNPIAGFDYEGMTFSGCKELTLNGADLSGGCTIANCVDTQSVTVTSESDFENLYNCTFNSNNRAIKITGNQTGSWSDPNIAVSGNTYDIEYTGTTDFSIQSANTLTVNNSSTGTLTIATPTFDLTIDSSEPASQINVFTTTTQTIIDSESSASQLIYTHSGETVDITVLKDGFIPYRQTGLVLSGSVSVDVQLVASREYDSGHGLTYTTDASWASNQLTVPTWGVTGQDVFSLIMEAFKSQTALRNTAFNLQMDGAGSLYLVDDAEGASDASIENLIECGVAYLDTSGTTTASWTGVKSVGTATGFTGEYQQVDGSGTTDARTAGIFNELVKTYGDASHGNFDYTDHLVLKYQPNGYRETRVDVLDSYGISALSPTLYIVAMQPVAIAAATGDPALTLTITDHGASPVTWNSKDFSITVTADAADSGEDILRELNYNLSLDATYNGKDPFNWPEMVLEAGTAYETLQGITEGGAGAALKGVRVIDGSGNPHPDFTRMQADDGTYYTVPVTANITISNLPDDVGGDTHLQIYNVTTATLIYSGDPAGTSYSDSYTNGDVAYASSGDDVRIRFAHTNAGTTFELGQTTVTATTDGITANGDNFIAADSVYATNGIDGSTITKFNYTPVNDQFNLIISSNFTAAEMYAFYCYTLTTTDGIEGAYGAFVASDAGNYKNITAITSIYLDNETTASKRQTDTARIYRDDGAYPVLDPTTSGFGIDINWQNVVYVVTAGSGLTAPQAAELTTAASVKTDTSQLTFTKTNELDINVQSVNGTSIAGSGTELDPWGP